MYLLTTFFIGWSYCQWVSSLKRNLLICLKVAFVYVILCVFTHIQHVTILYYMIMWMEILICCHYYEPYKKKLFILFSYFFLIFTNVVFVLLLKVFDFKIFYHNIRLTLKFIYHFQRLIC